MSCTCPQSDIYRQRLADCPVHGDVADERRRRGYGGAMGDRRRDWRLYGRIPADRVTVGDGWQWIAEGTLATMRREHGYRVGSAWWQELRIVRP